MPKLPADLETGLIAVQSTRTSSSSTLPDLVCLDGRAVSADFLRWFERVTEQVLERATRSAIPYLEEQVKRRENEIAELEAADDGGGVRSDELARTRSTAVRSADDGQRKYAIQLSNANRWLHGGPEEAQA